MASEVNEINEAVGLGRRSVMRRIMFFMLLVSQILEFLGVCV